jgi:hypothetical protein
MTNSTPHSPTPTPYPLPVKCDMSNGRIEFADGELLCTMPPTCVNGSWEHKRDLILDGVNQHAALQAENVKLRSILKQLANVTNENGMNRNVKASIVSEAWKIIARSESL